MKDEIKEIIKDMNLVVDFDKVPIFYTKDKIRILLDYITNLQEENERLKELNVCVGCNNNPDYKSRNEKAITDLDILIEIIYQQPTENGADDLWLLDKLNGIKFRLNGGDEE